MLYLNSVRMAPGLRSALAVACGVALSSAQLAWADESLEPTVVTASRMPQLLQTAPIGATVITSEQIQRSGVADANEAIRKLAGVAAKSDLNNGRENQLDLRGFGSTADQNLVVLVDGIRISENEGASARLTAIPLEIIDRIEIVRGGASVLWGEGASAGVINIILKHPDGETRAAKLSAGLETFGGQEAVASGQWGFGKTAFNASAKRVRSDGARDNAAYKQDAADLGVQWRDAGWRAGLQYMQEDQDVGLPGSMSASQLQTNRRYTGTPNDYATLHLSRFLANVTHEAGPWTATVDTGYRVRRSTYQYVSSYGTSINETSSIQSQVTPRLVYADKLVGADIKTVVGLDWQGWDFDGNGYYGPETGAQQNQAAFAQAEATLPTQTRLSLGWREEHVQKQGDVASIGLAYDRHDKLHAGEFGVSQTLVTGWDAYGRLASSYRLPNVDENRVTSLAQALLPQRNQDREIGLKWAQDGHHATVRVFHQNTENEIAFNDLLFANVNLDPTRRKGVEFEGHASLSKVFGVSASWQQLTARYREGPNAGREMTLVAPHTATMRLDVRLDDHNSFDFGAQYLSRMRFGEDVSNQCGTRIPSSYLLDGRYAWTDRVWTVALSGTNLADKKGYNYGYSCDASSVYPYVGRSMKITVSRQF